ncbi:MAG TPA: hypothetical protein VKF62_12600, partial [Planctomycetota bacterium]|nr:hypothetical protein [Planctomycetota bacterium]
LTAAGSDEVRLRKLLESRPGTLAAARAALRLGDGAFERGEAAAAASLFRLAASAGDAATRTAAIARRSTAALLLGDRAEMDRLVAASGEGPVEAQGQTHTPIEWLGALEGALPAPPGPSGARLSIAWTPLAVPADADTPRALGFDPSPAVAGGEAFLQTRRFLHVCDLATGTFVGRVDLEELLPHRTRGGEARGIRRTRPAASGTTVAVVHGEASPSGAPSNALAVFERTRGASTPLRLRWARLPGGDYLRVDGGRAKEERLDGFVFSEEPLLYGERLYCGLQRVAGEVASYLACFDARTGELRFLRWLCTGSEFDPLLPRMQTKSASNVSGSGPIASGGVVFYGTNLGVVVALDAESGECLLAYRTARRPPLEARENPRFADLGLGRPVAGPAGFAIAPGDSAFLYAFAFPGARGPSPLLHPPQLLREASLYAGWWKDAHVFLANSGGEQNVAAVDPVLFRRIDSAPLGPDEAFLSSDTDQPREPALARGRLFAASDRYLYVFDLSRELYMEAAIPPPIDPKTGLHGSGRAILGNLVAVPGGILSATPRSLVLFRERGG